jgi:hypothetical protein
MLSPVGCSSFFCHTGPNGTRRSFSGFKLIKEDLRNAEVHPLLNIFSAENIHYFKYLSMILVPLLIIIKNAEVRLNLLVSPEVKCPILTTVWSCDTVALAS